MVAGGALAVAPAASAHITVSPERIPPARVSTLTFTVPNERRAPATAVAVAVRAAEVVEIEAKPGWRAQRVRGVVTWRGGPIAPGQFETFRIQVRPRGERVAIVATESYRSGRRDRYVIGAVAAAAPPVRERARDSGARTLGKAALAVALAAAVVALAAAFLALYVWLRSPLQDES